MSLLFPYFIAASITVISILLLKPLALRLGLVDEPGGRKFHEGNVPLIGGMSMFLGFSFALLTLDISLSTYRCLIAGSGLLIVTGLLDDFRELTPRSRLFVQIFVGILMVWWGNISLQSLGNLFSLGEIKTGFVAFPLTILAVVGVINAVNMTDGADGLAGTLALIEFFYLGWLAHHEHALMDMQLINLMIAVLLAFLCFNFPWCQKASVFMGDNGSMWLGFLLTWFCVALSQAPHCVARPVVFLWIMAIPLWDMSTVIFKRLMRGFSPFKADRGHLHHCLLQCGFSSLQVTVMISLLSALLGLIGIVGEKYHVADSILFIGFVILFTIYLFVLHRVTSARWRSRLGFRKHTKNSI